MIMTELDFEFCAYTSHACADIDMNGQTYDDATSSSFVVVVVVVRFKNLKWYVYEKWILSARICTKYSSHCHAVAYCCEGFAKILWSVLSFVNVFFFCFVAGCDACLHAKKKFVHTYTAAIKTTRRAIPMNVIIELVGHEQRRGKKTDQFGTRVKRSDEIECEFRFFVSLSLSSYCRCFEKWKLIILVRIDNAFQKEMINQRWFASSCFRHHWRHAN